MGSFRRNNKEKLFKQISSVHGKQNNGLKITDKILQEEINQVDSFTFWQYFQSR